MPLFLLWLILDPFSLYSSSGPPLHFLLKHLWPIHATTLSPSSIPNSQSSFRFTTNAPPLTKSFAQILEEMLQLQNAGASSAPALDGADSIPLRDLRIFFQTKNQGKGAALRRGFAEVTGDIILVQDADLEYDPRDYGKLLEPILDGRADVVFGSRFLGGPQRVHYFWHYVANKSLTLLSDIFTNLKLTDMETCYKVFRREVLQGIQLKSNRFGFEPEITAKVAKGNWRIYEVPISYAGRTYEEGKKITWKDGLQALWCIIRYRFPD